MAAPTSRTPMVSVVTCTRDASARLRRTLESLCHQTLGRHAFEVVVVDDGSTDDTHEVLRAFEPRLPLRWTRQRRSGVALARNHGLFFARGVVVLFLDEGAAEPDLLERHLEAHRRFPEPRFAVLGRSLLDASIEGDPLMRFAADLHGSPWSNPRAGPGELLDWRHFRAARSSCKRGFLVFRGVFNAAFRSCGEDGELAYRLSRHGFQVVHEPGASTRIVENRSIEEVCARMRREGEASATFAGLHPAPEVQAWTGAATAAEVWRELGPVYHSIVRSAFELDRIARARAEVGLPLERAEQGLLHRSYAAAFEASRAKGLIDASEPSARATALHSARAPHVIQGNT